MKARNNRHHSKVMADASLMFESSAELSDRERLFTAFYIQTMDAPAAALAAGYTGNQHSRRTTAWRLLHKPTVRKAVENYLHTIYMSVAELKARLSAIARGSFEDFIHVDTDTGQVRFDFAQAKEKNVLSLIKKFKTRTTYTNAGERIVTTELEIYDAQAALIQIAKLHGLLRDSMIVETTTGENPFEAMRRVYQESQNALKNE